MNCRPQVTLLSQFMNQHGFDVTHTTYKNINHEILFTKIRRFIVDQLKRFFFFFSIFFLAETLRKANTHSTALIVSQMCCSLTRQKYD